MKKILFLLLFTSVSYTLSGQDTTPPAYGSSIPDNNSSDISVNNTSEISITFSEDIVEPAEGIESIITINPSIGFVASISLTDASKVNITLNSILQHSTPLARACSSCLVSTTHAAK